MEFVNIEKLVEKYLAAEASLQEETILKNYLTGGAIAPHLQEYESLFNYFAIAKEDTFIKTLKLDFKKPIKRNFKWLSVALALVVLLSVFIGKQQYKTYLQRKEAKKIYTQVSKSLELLSTNLKKGEQAVTTLYTYENTIHRILK